MESKIVGTGISHNFTMVRETQQRETSFIGYIARFQ